MTRVRLAGQRTFHSLRVRNYRLFFFSQLISLTGTWMQTTAQSWLVLDLTGRATAGSALGLMVALQFLPMLLFGMWGGVIADRLDKRRTLIWTQASAAVLAVALWLIVLTGVTQLWMIYVLAFLLGVVTVFDNPARQSFVIEMVGSDDVVNAVGLNSAVFNSARLIGPAVAGILIHAIGISPSFLLNAISFVPVIAALAAMRTSELTGSPRFPVPRVRSARAFATSGRRRSSGRPCSSSPWSRRSASTRSSCCRSSPSTCSVAAPVCTAQCSRLLPPEGSSAVWRPHPGLGPAGEC